MEQYVLVQANCRRSTILAPPQSLTQWQGSSTPNYVVVSSAAPMLHQCSEIQIPGSELIRTTCNAGNCDILLCFRITLRARLSRETRACFR